MSPSKVCLVIGAGDATGVELANEQATKDRLKDVTTQAVDRGVFGAPTFFVGEQMFWGQDRIEQLKAALRS